MRKCPSTSSELGKQTTEFHAQITDGIFRCRIKPSSVHWYPIASGIDGVSSRLRYRPNTRQSFAHIYDHSSCSSQCHLVLRFQGITRGYVQRAIGGSPYCRLAFLFLNERATIGSVNHIRRLACLDASNIVSIVMQAARGIINLR